MTPAESPWEATFIQLWREGASYTVIARALGIPGGTVGSRASRLVKQGKITPRPRGGSYPKQQALMRAAGPVQRPVQTTVQNSAPVQTTVHSHADQTPASPELSRVLNALVERLSAIEETLKQGEVQRNAPVQEYAPVQNYALPGVEPPKLSAEDRKSERWNIYMPRWIRQRIERAAAHEGLSPSQFLQRLCGPWAATWQDPEAAP